MQKKLVTVQATSKKFCHQLKRSMWYGLSDLTSSMLGLSTNRSQLRPKEFWALKDVSFELKPGECLGLIGRNGAGKSTLLKMLNGLIQPDEGSIQISGKVGALIELGAGFNPILSGIENIYINGQILGFTKKEIDQKLTAIADFAEIDEFLETPVQNYSSGMRARLGFAVAAQMEPDILLVDEVLAVGDMKFRSKCYRRIAQLKRQGTAIILVSHNANTILSVCDQALYLKRGKVITYGAAFEAMAQYEEDLLEVELEEKPAIHHKPSQDVKILAATFQNEEGKSCKSFTSGEKVKLDIQVQTSASKEHMYFKVMVKDLSLEGANVMHFDSKLAEHPFFLQKGNNTIGIDIPFMGLRQGIYALKIYAYQKDELNILDMVNALTFQVKKSPILPFDAYYHTPHFWS